MDEFWYDYIKPKYHEKKNCVIYKDIAEDFKTRFDISN